MIPVDRAVRAAVRIGGRTGYRPRERQADTAGIIRWRGMSGRRYCHVVTRDPPTRVSTRSVKDRPLYTS